MSFSKGFFQSGGESVDAMARARFREDYMAELARARSKGYTEEHDHEHGPQHLLDWATEYVYLGEPIKVAGMIAAARALLACTVHEHFRAARQQLALPVQDADLREKIGVALYGHNYTEAHENQGIGFWSHLVEEQDRKVDAVLAVLHPAQDEAATVEPEL